ncbi:DUF3995 domain-containing protein [Maricaulis sp. CAU 1757]
MVQIIIGWLTFAIMTAIAAVHAYWGFGGLWPAETEVELVRTVIGTESEYMPPPQMIFIIAILLFGAGAMAVMRGVFDWDFFVLLRLPLFGLAVIFLARGLITYIPGLFPPALQPFGSLNAEFYSPLCIILGLAFGYLSVSPHRSAR